MCLRGSAKTHARVAIDRHRHGIGQTRCGYRGQPLHTVQQLLEKSRGAFSGISIAHRIERNQIKIPGIEAVLVAWSAVRAQKRSDAKQKGRHSGSRGYQHAFGQQLANEAHTLAPSARRTGISLRRSAARASIMLATLAQAMSRTKPPNTSRNSLKKGRSRFRKGSTFPPSNRLTRRPFLILIRFAVG